MSVSDSYNVVLLIEEELTAYLGLERGSVSRSAD